MINNNNFKALLKHLQFEETGNLFTKNFAGDNVFLKVDFEKKQLEYPESAGLIINERQTCNFSQVENAVVFECVHKLLEKGYKPEHIELEPKWKLGHGASGGRADILVKNQKNKPLLIIECKTYGKEFGKAWKEMLDDGGQLFSYAQQISETEFICLYASEFDDKNNLLLAEQRIISHKDNEKILEQGNKLKSFKKASNVKRRYEVWKETYQLEFTETGIFESNIQAYQVGKNKYTLDIDTRPITDKDKEGKYHDFRTILRQHNIARKETAFEVLVNLFLSKIVDEEENKTELEFYWKGIAYDNYYDFVDRLQKLYQIGMRKFLNDEIMYISNKQIDDAFWTVKNKRNATKKTIQEYFRKLKFFSNNAFSFINVHNERLFNKNAKVLVEIVQMWQGLRLKTKEQNQFLGDMFEYFLDNSIKQSEGQFFTPMPICKFIVMALPLEQKIQQSSEPLRAIDYACGSGHFLTEYAHQIKPYIEKYKEAELAEYYENIIGIEKEDRLAKVAKVSAYMYGQDQIRILEEDALIDTMSVKLESFDVLVANPPFAVEGFLHNLDEKQKEPYELIKTTGINSNTNNIQCFFIERAKQLMSPDGIVGIIVPSSVLSNSDATHISTREIILKYFDMVSIVELGSGTFGKTGTNTVVLFLRRKAQKPEPAEHYQNRVDDYFDGIEEGDEELNEYQDLYLIRKYCEHTELPYEEYKKLFGVTVDTIDRLEQLVKTDIFKDYKVDFDNSTDIKNLVKKPYFKKLSQAAQKAELDKRFIQYLFAIEKDKLFYFMLAYENKQQVLIVKSPSDNKQQKQFLGYEWSGAKGSEGIKYNGGNTVNDIITPLFDPKNVNNPEKINYLIQQNFLGKKPDNNLSDYVTYVNVTDILDFSRKDFNKSFSLTPKKSISIETKWDLVKLGDVVDIKGGKRIPKGQNFSDEITNHPYIRVSDFEKNTVSLKNMKYISNETFEEIKRYTISSEDVYISIAGTIGLCGVIPNELNNKSLTENAAKMVLSKDDKLNKHYLVQILNNDIIQQDIKNKTGGIGVPKLGIYQIQQIKIPLPPKEVQQQIVRECEAIDNKVEQSNAIVDKAKGEIEERVKAVFYAGFTERKLGEACNMQAGKFVSASDIKDEKGEELYPCYGGNGLRGYTKTFTHNGTFSLIGRQGALCGNVHKVSGTFHATEHAVVATPNSDIDVNWFYYILKSMNLNQYATGVAQPGLSVKNIKPVLIPVPPLSEQKQLVSEIGKLEAKINAAKQITENAIAQKQAVMEKYL